MNTIAVDDRRLAVNAVQRIMSEIDPAGTHTGYTDPADALKAAKAAPIDVAFLDIEMPVINGLELAKRLKEICASTNMIFVTGHPEYALEAFGLYASGFLSKPVEEADLRLALENLRHPIQWEQTKKLRIQCFGNFQVFYNSSPVFFRLNQTTELFAYLVDRRGAVCPEGSMFC